MSEYMYELLYEGMSTRMKMMEWMYGSMNEWRKFERRRKKKNSCFGTGHRPYVT